MRVRGRQLDAEQQAAFRQALTLLDSVTTHLVNDLVERESGHRSLALDSGKAPEGSTVENYSNRDAVCKDWGVPTMRDRLDRLTQMALDKDEEIMRNLDK